MITERDFDEKYNLVTNQFERAKQPLSVADEDLCGFGGKMFETYGEEIEFVHFKNKLNRVVTIIESDTDVDVNGFHFVNRIGYLITEEPITDEFEIKLDF